MTTDQTPPGLPPLFLERLAKQHPGLFDNLAGALTEPPVVAVRYNLGKGCAPASADTVPWCPSGCYLGERPRFTLDPALHQGLYYVQDPSSMFIGQVARQLAGGRPLRWLDACAAPGGKTTCVLDALPAGSLVVANEIVPQRAAALRENVIKWGNPGVMVTRGDTASLSRLKGVFDVVAADVPCSGEGMMRKDPAAVAQWSESLVRECAARQREIVANLWQAVAPSGWMVYSTCTFNREENDAIVDYIASTLGGVPEAVDGIDPAWGIAGDERGYRFIPGRVRGEGLFMAVLRKPGTAAPDRAGSSRRKNARTTPVPSPIAAMLANDGEGFAIDETDGRVNAFPAPHRPLLATIGSTAGLDVIHHGTLVARRKGRDLVPDHSLALSTLLNPEAFPRVELTEAEALDYLRGDNPRLSADTPRGILLLTRGGRPLGFAKHLGPRTNSLFPREWRIHSL